MIIFLIFRPKHTYLIIYPSQTHIFDYISVPNTHNLTLFLSHTTSFISFPPLIRTQIYFFTQYFLSQNHLFIPYPGDLVFFQPCSVYLASLEGTHLIIFPDSPFQSYIFDYIPSQTHILPIFCLKPPLLCLLPVLNFTFPSLFLTFLSQIIYTPHPSKLTPLQGPRQTLYVALYGEDIEAYYEGERVFYMMVGSLFQVSEVLYYVLYYVLY